MYFLFCDTANSETLLKNVFQRNTLKSRKTEFLDHLGINSPGLTVGPPGLGVPHSYRQTAECFVGAIENANARPPRLMFVTLLGSSGEILCFCSFEQWGCFIV